MYNKSFSVNALALWVSFGIQFQIKLAADTWPMTQNLPANCNQSNESTIMTSTHYFIRCTKVHVCVYRNYLKLILKAVTWSQPIYLYLMHWIHFFFSNSVQKERGTCSWQTLSNGNGILEQFPARKKRKRLCISVVTFYCMDNSLVFILVIETS